MKCLTSMLPTLVAGALLAGCAAGHAKPGAQPGAVTFPDPSHATMPEGTFVYLQNLRQVGPGMTKSQLYALLGTPDFNEGVFGVKRWNYIFDFRDRSDRARYTRCQYQIQFDSKGLSQAVFWNPASCREVLAVHENTVSSAPAMMPAQPIRLSSDTLFDFDRADLSSRGRDQLAQLLQQIQAASAVQEILIVGYTDRIGSKNYNLALSKRRAESVRNYLVAGGVNAGVIQVEGRGEADPVVQCPRSSRAALIVCLSPNRRVELSGTARP